jgi:hypothetical protein
VGSVLRLLIRRIFAEHVGCCILIAVCGIVIDGVKPHTPINSDNGAFFRRKFCLEDEIGGGKQKTKTQGGAWRWQLSP